MISCPKGALGDAPSLRAPPCPRGCLVKTQAHGRSQDARSCPTAAASPLLQSEDRRLAGEAFQGPDRPLGAPAGKATSQPERDRAHFKPPSPPFSPRPTCTPPPPAPLREAVQPQHTKLLQSRADGGQAAPEPGPGSGPRKTALFGDVLRQAGAGRRVRARTRGSVVPAGPGGAGPSPGGLAAGRGPDASALLCSAGRCSGTAPVLGGWQDARQGWC